MSNIMLSPISDVRKVAVLDLVKSPVRMAFINSSPQYMSWNIVFKSF